jgi:hypothetical protein
MTWFFYRWYVIFNNGNIDGMKRVKFFFFLRTLSVSKSICKIITNELTDISKITNESFFDWLFLSMSPLVSFVPTDCEYKYR